jgi:AcrR family transcriptional regulator
MHILTAMSIPASIRRLSSIRVWYHEPMSTSRLTRSERQNRTREDLIAAAARVFAAMGFDRATVDDVAEAAGYTKGAVYSNFASKTDLMLALISQRIAVQTEVAETAFAGETLDEGLRRLGRATADPDTTGREWLMLVAEFITYAMRDERARIALAAQYELARSLSASMIAEKYAEAGTTPPLPPRDIAIIIEALGVGIGVQALLDPENVSTDLQVVAVQRLLGEMPPDGVGS